MSFARDIVTSTSPCSHETLTGRRWLHGPEGSVGFLFKASMIKRAPSIGELLTGCLGC